MTTPPRKDAEELLVHICGYKANGDIDNRRTLPIIEATLAAAEKRYAARQLYLMAEKMDLAWSAEEARSFLRKEAARLEEDNR